MMSNLQREITFIALIFCALSVGLLSNITSAEGEVIITLILRTLFVAITLLACRIENVREKSDIRSTISLIVGSRFGEAAE
ncbi:hypothetical protein A2764_00745 [Candidatus Kaiserbacteria bacterium RIFCSPHIGHO2_01_FULL_55_79]|nr:MAG: hypothetical protein A2764_00745 [Candidatus Kaiserbacteria bacterium RIFCSPHIGHO2_01_FULL_55_79]